MINVILDLAYNLSLLVAISSLSAFIRRRKGQEYLGILLQGLLFGGAAVVGMMRPVTLGPGLIFDGRSVVLSLCALFFGPWAAAVATGMALAYRIHMGGIGAIMGVSVILSSSLIGLAFRFRPRLDASTRRILLLGLAVHAVMVLLMFTLPGKRALETILTVGLPVMITYPLATLLIGKMLAGHEASLRSLEALRSSEETYRLAMEATSDGLWDWDLPSGRVYYSPGYFAMLGHPPGAFPPSPDAWMALVHPEDLARVQAANQACIEGRRDTVEVEFRMRAQDGQWRHILGRGKCVSRDGRGQAVRLLGTHVDLTERKRAEQALRESEARLRGYIENAPVGIFICDETGRYREVNPAAAAITGYSREELLELGIFDILPPESHALVTHLFMEVAKTGKTSGEFDFRRKDGRLGTWALEGVRLSADRFMGLTLDITERRRLEEESRLLQARLQQAQTMESMGSLAGGVAHDMNNVLGAILGLASTWLEREPTEAPTRQAFETIARAAERGGRMVKSLLSFARQKPAESLDVDLNGILREEVNLLERTTLSRIRLELDLAPDLKPVYGDAAALSNTLMNLCVNALDAMPGPGVLTLRTRNLGGDRVEVQVADTGTGMPKDVLDKALDPFFTTKEHGKGTGLGLSLAYNTVKAHGGELDLWSEPGRGTRVTLSFPAAQASGSSEAVQEEAPRGRRSGLDVLLVDDDDLIQSALQALLEALGHRARGVTSGEAALQLLRDGHVADVVILDMNMPGLGGEGTLPRLKELRPGLPVLLATGRADQAALDLAERMPGVTLLPKPFGLRQLEQVLHELSGGAGDRP